MPIISKQFSTFELSLNIILNGFVIILKKPISAQDLLNQYFDVALNTIINIEKVMGYDLGDISDDGYWLLTKNGWEETKNNNQKTETLRDLISDLKIELYESLSIVQLKEIAEKNNMTYINSYNGHSKQISTLKKKFLIIDEMVKLNFNFNSKHNQDLIHKEFLGTPSCKFNDYGCSCVYRKHCFNLVKSIIGNDELIKLGIYRYSTAYI